MNQFLKLNRHKLKFAFKVTSLLFMALVLIVFIIAIVNGQVPEASLIIIVTFFAGVIFPCFIIFISYLAWLYKQWAKRKAFSKPPFDQLHVLGFSDELQAEKTKWAFTEKVKAGKINGFDLIADVLYGDRHIIEVRTFTAWRQIKKNEYKRLSKEFKTHDIEFDIGCLIKRYNIKRLSVFTIDDLRSDLHGFTELLKQNGFEPQKQNGWA